MFTFAPRHTLQQVVGCGSLVLLLAAPAVAGDSVSNLAEQAGAAVQMNLGSDEEAQAGTEIVEEAGEEAATGDGPETLSFFANGPLAEVHAAYAAHRYAAAKKLLSTVDADAGGLPGRYLRASIDARLGLHKIAAPQLSALATDWPLLSDLLSFEAGVSFERANEWTQATQAYAAVSAKSAWYAPARLAWAKIDERRRQFASAIEALSGLVVPGVTLRRPTSLAAVWVNIADLARSLGDFNGEHRALLAAWALFPHSPQAAIAQRRLVGLPYPPKWKVARAETLLSLHHNDEAMRALTPMLATLEPSNELGCRAHFAHGAALRKERKHARALSVLRRLVAVCPSLEVLPRALYVLGYSESIIDQAAAIATYETLSRDFPTHTHSDDALFYAADLRRRRGDLDSARATFAAVAERHPGGDFVGQALFGEFWVSWQQGQPMVAPLEKLEALPESLTTHEQLQRARYWRGRVLAHQGKVLEANALFARVAGEGASTYYGLIAGARLDPTGVDSHKALLATGGRSTLTLGQTLAVLEVRPTLQRGLALLKLGHRDAASDLFAATAECTAQELRALFDVLTVAKRPGMAGVVARALLRRGGEGLSWKEANAMYAAAYPTPFRKLIERHSRSAGISADLMQALVREESAFNPRARSTTGALGLAQLMPQTAARVAKNLRVSLSSSLALFEPGQNLQLGTAYLGELKRQFSGNLVYAVASYNAGPGAVNHWLRKLPDLELDEWVEEVPVEETRHYVKRVLGSFAAYQRLAGVVEGPRLAFLSPSAR